jgi:hypothetical protein
VDELDEKIRMIIGTIQKSRLNAIFPEWQRRVDEWTKRKGDYFE